VKRNINMRISKRNQQHARVIIKDINRVDAVIDELIGW
jgi:hypothetical protein